MPMRRTDVFRMPPSAVPAQPEQQIPGLRVAAVLEECSAYIRRSHIKLEAFEMKISELSSKVDELIGLAKDQKNSASQPATGSMSPPDDPEVQRLADRIDEAIRVLKGGNVENTGSQQGSGAQPGGINPATGLPPPPTPVDPNAPAV